MNIIYIANDRLPTEKAYGVNIVSMCSAFAMAGHSVELVIPKRKNDITDDIFSYFGVEENFDVRYVTVPDLVHLGPSGFRATQIAYSFALLKETWDPSSVVFTRDELSGYLLRKKGMSVFYDMHGFPEKKRFLWKTFMRAMEGIVCTNEWKKKQCHELFSIPKKKLIVARNGFDPLKFDVDISKKVARKKLHLDQDKKLIVYTGHLYDWKGVDVLARASELFDDTIQVLVVGGSQKEIDDLEKRVGSHRMHLVGQKPHVQMPYYMKAADVLVLPNSAKSKIPRYEVYTQYDTSPIKLFEYMASNVPIVASDLPSIREILSQKNAYLFEPDNHTSLACGIELALSQKELSEKKADQAYIDVKDFSWVNRAAIIASFMTKKMT